MIKSFFSTWPARNSRFTLSPVVHTERPHLVASWATVNQPGGTVSGTTLLWESAAHHAASSVSAARDHAETLGMNCVFGHTPRVAQEQGRSQRPVVGSNIGCGIDLNVGYAKSRRATLGWSHGFAFGEYNDQACTVNLVTLSPHYRLPL